jgi:hypothetical protein
VVKIVLNEDLNSNRQTDLSDDLPKKRIKIRNEKETEFYQ